MGGTLAAGHRAAARGHSGRRRAPSPAHVTRALTVVLIQLDDVPVATHRLPTGSPELVEGQPIEVWVDARRRGHVAPMKDRRIISWTSRPRPEFQRSSTGSRRLHEEVEPRRPLRRAPRTSTTRPTQRLIPPLQDKVRERGLWATTSGRPRRPGSARSSWPTSRSPRPHPLRPDRVSVPGAGLGDAEILAHFGTPELKERLPPAVTSPRRRVRVSVTEPAGGSDPTHS